MADVYDYKLITDLEAKTTVGDSDLMVVGNNGAAAMRKVTFANVAAAIKEKISSWTFSALTTVSKTLTGAINELNAKSTGSLTGTYLSQTILYQKAGNTVHVQVRALTGLPGTTNTKIGTMPAGYRPADTVEAYSGVPSANGYTSCVRIQIESDGDIMAYNYGSNTGTLNVRASMAYVVA